MNFGKAADPSRFLLSTLIAASLCNLFIFFAFIFIIRIFLKNLKNFSDYVILKIFGGSVPWPTIFEFLWISEIFIFGDFWKFWKFWFFGIFWKFRKFWKFWKKFWDYYNFEKFFGVGPMANNFRVFILTLALTKILKFQNPY